VQTGEGNRLFGVIDRLILYVTGFEKRGTAPAEGEAQFSYSARDIPVIW